MPFVKCGTHYINTDNIVDVDVRAGQVTVVTNAPSHAGSAVVDNHIVLLAVKAQPIVRWLKENSVGGEAA